MRNPTFNDLLNKMREIHERKNHDYAHDDDPYSNFKQAALLSNWFKDPVDRVFVTLIGIKLARLAELLKGDKVALNESVDDTFLDLTVYAGLWAYYHKTIMTPEIRKPLYADSGFQTPPGRDTEVRP